MRSSGTHSSSCRVVKRSWVSIRCAKSCTRACQKPNVADVSTLLQLWGINNIKINVKYDRVVPDAKHNVVVVDLLETVVSSKVS